MAHEYSFILTKTWINGKMIGHLDSSYQSCAYKPWLMEWVWWMNSFQQEIYAFNDRLSIFENLKITLEIIIIIETENTVTYSLY